MNRQILLIEPNYKNKYPPMGLMKLSTYYKMCGDHVRFFKGDLLDLATEILVDELLPILNATKRLTTTENPNRTWRVYYKEIFSFVRKGDMKEINLIADITDDENIIELIKNVRLRFKNHDYFNTPKYDKVGITTLFTFYWKATIEAIKFATKLCKNKEDVMVGGIMSSLLPTEVFEETGIHPFVGQLSMPGVIDKDNDLIIDELPLDYSMLDEIDYKYSASDAYFAYMTRGCCNKCAFCAVPKLEPNFINHIHIKDKLDKTIEMFGAQKNLLLLDNNVFASDCFNQIVDEIKACGFQKNATYLSSNKYAIAIRHLRENYYGNIDGYTGVASGYNDRAYIRQCVDLYKWLIEKLGANGSKEYSAILKEGCADYTTATKESIIRLDVILGPHFERLYKPSKRKRIVDFNQGVDSRLINDVNMAKLAEINIEPLRIAFDHWELREIYERAIRTAARHGIRNLSNYLLYNFNDKPEDLYNRMRLNVDLCDELNVSIYSFPMKYHPIDDPEYFRNRNYIGKHWNRKFIRAIQAVLNSTKGKVGKGLSFFEQAFGRNVEEFEKILWMPEAFIIFRRKYDSDLRKRLSKRYDLHVENESNLTNEWWAKYNALSPDKLDILKSIVKANNFKDLTSITDDKEIIEVLRYYTISREE